MTGAASKAKGRAGMAVHDTAANGVHQIHSNYIHWICDLVQRIGTV